MIEQENITAEETNAAPMSDAQGEQSEPASDFLNNPAVTAYIEKAIQEGIQNALKGITPKANTADHTEQEKKNFEKMTYKERLNLFNSNPHVYKKLVGGK